MTVAAIVRANGPARGLTRYDPQKGVKTIALLEGIEKHYARAKDATRLQQAIRAKLEAQAEFVVWWDTQVEKQNGRPRKSLTDRKGFLASKNGLPDSVTIHRWRRKLADPKSFEATYEAVCAHYPKILEFQLAGAHVGQNTGETEWFTPAAYVEPARRVLGAIDLDPASTPEANTVIKAERFYTRRDDGLTKPWQGRVWMNPPYAYPLVEQFAQKFAASIDDGAVTAAIALVNNATETEWFQTIAGVCGAVCFPKGRIQFWHPKKAAATPLQGQALLYAGADLATFISEFAPLGIVWVKP